MWMLVDVYGMLANFEASLLWGFCHSLLGEPHWKCNLDSLN